MSLLITQETTCVPLLQWQRYKKNPRTDRLIYGNESKHALIDREPARAGVFLFDDQFKNERMSAHTVAIYTRFHYYRKTGEEQLLLSSQSVCAHDVSNTCQAHGIE